MTEHESTSDVERVAAAMQAIADIDFSGVIHRFASTYGHSQEVAESIHQELVRYLVLGATAPADEAYPVGGPPDGVDGCWHTFLLFTRTYADFCDRLGRFLHHEPCDDGLVDEHDMFDADSLDRFLIRYRAAFGTGAPTRYWPRALTMADYEELAGRGAASNASIR